MLVLKRLMVLMILMCAAAPAQQSIDRASLNGTVIDPSGAVVVGGSVTAHNSATNAIYKTTTDAQGRFHFPYLEIGQYEVKASAPGFHDEIKALELSAGAAVNLPLHLHIEDTTSVTIGAYDGPLPEADRTELRETISQREVWALPYLMRNYLDLALLAPGVSPANTASTQTLAETSEVAGQGYSINSQRNFSNSFVVDGLSANDDAAGVAGNVFSMDVVSEFQVVTAGGQAEFGRALAGYFNIVTRAGTNYWHGDAYGFLRNQRMNADNALSGSRLPLTQGQYGASLSGPLRKDRTFVFGNFEEGRLKTDGIVTVIPANATTINARLNATGYQGPLLPIGAGSTTLYPTTLHTDTLFLRGDHRFSEKDLFNVRYSLYQLSSLNARGVGGLNETSNGTSVFDVNHTIAMSNVATLSSRLYNETRGQFAYDSLNAPPNDLIGPAVTISGVAVFGRSTSSPTARKNYLYEAADNLVMERGAHIFKLGADFLYNNDTITYPQSLRGSYSFSSLANFLSDVYNSQGYTQNFGTPTVQQGNPNAGFYAQDEWKAAPSVTVNVGLRYDLEFLQTIDTSLARVSPRVGVAWSPLMSRKMVVRANYGIFYDRIPLRPLANALLSADNTTDRSKATFLSYTFSPGQTGAPAFPVVASAPPAGAVENFSLMGPNIRTPYSQQIGLGVEQQIGHRSTLDVSYQHLRGEHLIGSINTNINLDGSRPDPTRGNVKPYSSVFDSYYDGLETSYAGWPANWGYVRVSYTWSKAIDDVSEFFFSGPINNFNPGEDRSRADDDQRHRVVFDGILSAPDSWRGALTHGWKLSGILQYYSRLPFNVVTGSNTKQAALQRPCAVGYSLAASGGVNACTEGLAGAVVQRNAGVGFDFFGLNARLSRTFVLPDGWKVEAMAEGFNALNHRNDMIPNGTWGTGAYPGAPLATFGQATAVGDPRSVQLGARVEF